MKLLVFAHTPPPHHGQSYMVQLMLAGFGGDARRRNGHPPSAHGIECYHVNARFSRSLEDVGEFQGAKIILIFWFCLQAIWLRFRYGVKNFYYVPAPGKRVALYRDWLVMLLCRPFFKNVILHWHAAGMAKWLETSVQIHARAITYRLFKPVDLSIVLSRHNVADGEKLLSHHVRVVNNGIADLCPDFAQAVQPRHVARFEARRKLLAGEPLTPSEIQAAGGDPQVLKVLFLAHCMRQKGLFDTLEGVVLANARLQQMNSPLHLELTVAGEFVNQQEQADFAQRVVQVTAGSAGPIRVNYLGFVNGPAKARAFAGSDCFCFPTYYHAESFGLVVVEAMAFGLPIVTTRWRSIPEIMPPGYPGLVEPQSPPQIADALIRLMSERSGELMRKNFITRFTLQAHLTALAAAIHSVENEGGK
jgi:glycosyltransferase involved in cell wall biosynthesis